jgi:hypothetical protein
VVDIGQEPDVSVEGEIGRVIYKSDDGWLIVIEQNFAAPTGGPTRLEIRPDESDRAEAESDYGRAWDTEGIQQSLLRSVPLRDARKRLEALRVDRLASGVIERIPSDFVEAGDLGLARLAHALVTLDAIGINNPITVVARARTPHKQETWAARVRAARKRGLLPPADQPLGLTAKATLVLGQDL